MEELTEAKDSIRQKCTDAKNAGTENDTIVLTGGVYFE